MPVKIKGFLKWLYPGIGIKRWIGLSAFGVVMLILGTSHLRAEELLFLQVLDALALFSGIVILILGVKRIIRSFIAGFLPSSKEGELVDILYQKKHLSRGPKIAAIGGGTGLSVLLSGIREYTSNISAVVTVADDGGSSGRLRQEFDILPPGDIRNCLVALADAPALMRDLFQFRFKTGSELSGHSFGNLFITVMTHLTGDFDKAIKETSKVLALKGQVIPSTLDNVVLIARHKDGSITKGEDKIPKSRKPIEEIFLNPKEARPAPEALKAINEAEVIVLGPGSLYTSIIPNLLIKGVPEALAASQALKIYVCNAMTQPGETDGFSVSDHIKALIQHSHPRIMDYVIVNAGEFPGSTLERYAKEKSYPVDKDRSKIEKLGYRVIEDDICKVEDGVIRHNAEKLAKVLFSLLEEI